MAAKVFALHGQIAKLHKRSDFKYFHALLAKVTNKSGARSAANCVFIYHG